MLCCATLQELPDVRALQVRSQQLQVDLQDAERKKTYKAAEIRTLKENITSAQVRQLNMVCCHTHGAQHLCYCAGVFVNLVVPTCECVNTSKLPVQVVWQIAGTCYSNM